MDIMFMLVLVMKSRRKDPIRENGIQVITIRENLGDSNCMAMTRNTRNIPARMAIKIEVRFSVRISSTKEEERATPCGKSIFLT